MSMSLSNQDSMKSTSSSVIFPSEVKGRRDRVIMRVRLSNCCNDLYRKKAFDIPLQWRIHVDVSMMYYELFCQILCQDEKNTRQFDSDHDTYADWVICILICVFLIMDEIGSTVDDIKRLIRSLLLYLFWMVSREIRSKWEISIIWWFHFRVIHYCWRHCKKRWTWVNFIYFPQISIRWWSSCFIWWNFINLLSTRTHINTKIDYFVGTISRKNYRSSSSISSDIKADIKVKIST